MRKVAATLLLSLTLACRAETSAREPERGESSAAPPTMAEMRPEPNAVKMIADGGRVVFPQVISRVEAVYPPFERAERVRPSVQLQVTVTTNGDVRDVRVMDHPETPLAQAAVTAVKQWKYRPGTVDGRPTEMILDLSIHINIK